MPTPSGFSAGTLSNIFAGMPIWCRLRASVNPPMPPPAISTVIMPPCYLRVVMTWPAQAGNREATIASGRTAFGAFELAAGLQHQLAQPDRSRIELGAGRVEHELLVDAGVKRRLDGHQR